MIQAISSERETVRCEACKLVQFVGAIRTCRRCHKSLEEAPKPTLALVVAAPIDPEQEWRAEFARLVRRARKKARMSGKAVGKAMGSTRQYMCKVENRRAFPQPAQAVRIAAAIGCPIGDLFPAMPPRELTDLDCLLHAIAGYVDLLSPYAMEEILQLAKRMQPKKERVRDPRLLIM